MIEPDISLHDSIDRNLGTSAVLESYLHASVLLEQIVPGCVVEEIDGFLHIRYGRPKVHVEHEVVATDGDLAGALAVVARHPEILPAYLAIVTRLGSDWDADVDPGLSRVSRTTVMRYQLPDVVPFGDPSLRRLTDPDDLRMLARVRDDHVLDVEHFTDAIACYVLEVEDEPVSSALLIPSLHNTAVIEHVHTLAAYRRRGYGRWLLRALHAEAARMGMRQTILGSNAAGLPLYTALGYEPLCYLDVYLVEA